MKYDREKTAGVIAAIKKLREETGTGLFFAKKALEKHEYDYDKALADLKEREKELSNSREHRALNEGKIVTWRMDDAIYIVMVKCETDFVAKTDKFQDFCEFFFIDFGEQEWEDNIEGNFDRLKQVTGENLIFKMNSIHPHEEEEGAVFGEYVHHNGKIGTVVMCSDGLDEEMLNDLALHISAFSGEEWREQPFVKDPARTLDEILDGKGICYIKYEIGSETDEYSNVYHGPNC